MPHKPLAGYITFFEPDQRTARESLVWEAGECVGYREEFLSGDQHLGAYVCHLTIAAPKLTMQVGSASQYVPAAARTHGVPPLAPLTVAAALPPAAALPTSLPLNKEGRYAARLHLMQQARTGLEYQPQRRSTNCP